jgi:uncharacterized repeat protein (TIGR03803 family)
LDLPLGKEDSIIELLLAEYTLVCEKSLSEAKMKLIFSALVILFCLSGLVSGQSTETVLYSFGAYPTDGAYPSGGLLFDSAGNIYGVTEGGGEYCENDGGCGTIYELSPANGGGWTETILYNFCATENLPFCPDGYGPQAGLIMDGTGNLYGTTYFGGPSAHGTVFRLSPPTGGIGNWTETVLWNFTGGTTNGLGPGFGKLNMDAAGNLYGTTTEGGAKNYGVVFELSSQSNGTYSFSILHSFTGPDGAYPTYGVAIDSGGNLYGTTQLGGVRRSVCTNESAGCGVVYELSPSSGTWIETVLYKFTGDAGRYPISPISLDQSGNLYGTFEIGGEGSCYLGTCGGVFKLVPEVGRGVTRYSFYFNGVQGNGAPMDGVLPEGIDTAYGTVADAFSAGNVYRLTGKHQTILYNFCSLPNCADGFYPQYGVILNRDGMLYGVTYEGGANGLGVVYSVAK